jgi:hypothetical protein
MTDMPAGAGGEFRVGLVFGRSLAMLRRQFLKFLALAFAASLPPLLVALHPPSPGQVFTMDYGLLLAGVAALSLLLFAICQPAIIYGAFQTMRGRDFHIGESLRKALERLMPVIGVSILMLVSIMIGSLLLLVPGLILWTMFLVAVPVCVVERLGPVQSLRRSAELTKGNRWRLFGMFLLLAVLVSAIRFALSGMLVAVGGRMVAGVGDIAFDAVATSLELIVFAVAYHDLRVAREGIDIERIAALFD